MLAGTLSSREACQPAWSRTMTRCEAIVDAACEAWRCLTAEAGRIKSLCTYPWIPKVKT
jgi:hypothetical protein